MIQYPQLLNKVARNNVVIATNPVVTVVQVIWVHDRGHCVQVYIVRSSNFSEVDGALGLINLGPCSRRVNPGMPEPKMIVWFFFSDGLSSLFPIFCL